MVWNCKFSVFLFVCLITASMDVQALDSLRTEKHGDQYYVIHQVEEGETLYSLSKRYDAHLNEIVRANDIMNNNISLGEEIRIPIAKPLNYVRNTPDSTPEKTHVVASGQTLFAISRMYDVSVKNLKKWNALASNEIEIGQALIVSGGVKASLDMEREEMPQVKEKVVVKKEKKEKEKKSDEEEIPAGFEVYYVQNGDLLGSIARKYNVRPDSIVIWNDLQNTYLSIGQKLLIRGEVDKEHQRKAEDVTTKKYGTIRKTVDQSGFTKIYEEGVASKIDSSVETDKYLALHRTLPMGTLIEVRNLMNNQKVFVRVVGKLPETGLNEKVLVRLTPVCFERLGVIDPKARVEVSYYED